MKKVLATLTSRWFLTLIGAVILSLLVWFFGPVIAVADARPLESDLVRLIVIFIIFLIWVLLNVRVGIKARQTDDRLMKDVASPSPAGSANAASAEEVAVIDQRMQQAMAMLRKAKLGGGERQYLYQLPWYIIIGPPGSGKTTALVNSGLNFPLADKLGGDAVRGVGGTRDCDWWFSDQAVLIDTAGRYTTQDSDRSVDNAGWLGFLGLLKKYRGRQPINGALVAISLSDLAILSPAQRLEHARAIKLRIRELHEQLGVRFPIYVLFTKADLIAGFVEFFSDMGKEEREQVWGMTFALDDGKTEGGAIAAFDAEFGALLQRLEARLVDRLQQEQDIQRRSLIYGFPQQFASLKEAAHDFLDEIFKPSRLEERPLLRGIYFTSGTQAGTPIDRLMGAMASTFGIGRQALSAFGGPGRSYFLTRLLLSVVFNEAGMVGANRAQERRSGLIRTAAYAGAALALILVAVVWFLSYQSNQKLMADIDAQSAIYKSQVAELGSNPAASADVAPLLPALQTARAMPAGYAERNDSPPMIATFGLYQGRKLGAQEIELYRRALNGIFLPRLLLRLEDQLKANLNKPEFLYEGLKVYLMLGGQGPLDRDLVKQWMALDWANQFPGDANQPGRAALATHLDALLEQPVTPIPLNGPLVADVRASLSKLPLAERAYALIKQTPEARQLPLWRVIDHVGPGGARVFLRPSGAPLSDGVPGLYTRVGFHTVFLPLSKDVVAQVGKENWIFDPNGDTKVDPAQIDKLRQDVLTLYYKDYGERWDQLLGDISIVPLKGAGDSAEVLNILSATPSPLKTLLTAIDSETRLTVAPPLAGAAAATAAANAAGANVALKAAPVSGQLASVLGTANGAPPPDAPGKPVEDRFARLHQLVAGADGAPAQIDDVIRTLGDLYKQVSKVASSSGGGGGGAAAPDVAAAQQLESTAKNLPPPLNTMMSSVASRSTSVTVGGTRAQLNALWVAQVLPLCTAATENRYPIFKDGSAEVTLDDFAHLFGPKGLIDSFFDQNLRPFVNTATNPWKWQQVGNAELGLSPAALAQFQHAAAIRDSFFASGGATPSVSFELSPVDLDAGATQVVIDLGGQSLTYDHGPIRPVVMKWPGPNGTSQVRLAFAPDGTITKDGPWSWFRLLDEAGLSNTGLSEQFRVTFHASGHTASFALRANSVMNPFGSKVVQQFRCPTSL
jgi:type VI secretion system protein ImpL